MTIEIRQENKTNHKAVFNLIEKAFESDVFSDHKEQFLVERIRKSPAFIPALSLVAAYKNEIAGHVLLSKILIKNEKDVFESLALAPLSVMPEYQNQGIGSMLINKSHEIAKDLGHQSIAVLGHEKYYSKFGYIQSDTCGIKFPFDVPKENRMVVELTKNGIVGVNGMVEYPDEFYEQKMQHIRLLIQKPESRVIFNKPIARRVRYHWPLLSQRSLLCQLIWQ